MTGRLLYVELKSLWTNPLFYLFLVALVVMGLIFERSYYLITQEEHADMLDHLQVEMPETPYPDHFQTYDIREYRFYRSVTEDGIFLILPLAAVFIFTRNYETRGFSQLVLLGYGKTGIFFSKLFVYYLAVAVMSFVAPLTIWIRYDVFPYISSGGKELLFPLFLRLLMTLLLSAEYIFIGSFFTKTRSSLIAMLAAFFVLNTNIISTLFPAATAGLGRLRIKGCLSGLTRGQVGYEDCIPAMIISISMILLLSLLSYLIFRRKELR